MFETVEQTETEFYAAFTEADLPRMMRTWDVEDSVACIHPMGTRIEGLDQIEESWRLLFESGNRLQFLLSAWRTYSSPDLIVRCVQENISFYESGQPKTAVVLATNAYRRRGSEWRMVLHHGSPAPLSHAPTATGHPDAVH
jgi:ketosteroid isomerase-like protein